MHRSDAKRDVSESGKFEDPVAGQKRSSQAQLSVDAARWEERRRLGGWARLLCLSGLFSVGKCAKCAVMAFRVYLKLRTWGAGDNGGDVELQLGGWADRDKAKRPMGSGIRRGRHFLNIQVGERESDLYLR